MTSSDIQVWVCWSDCVRRTDLEQIFVRSSPSRKCINTKLRGVHRRTRLAAASSLIFNCICLDDIIRYIGESVQLWLYTMYTLVTNSSELYTTQEVDWYQAWRPSSYDQPGSSITFDIQLHRFWWHHQICRGESAALAEYNVCTWNKF